LDFRETEHDEGTRSIMTEMATKLERAIEQAASQYYRLVVVVGLPGAGKTTNLQAVAQQHGYPYLNVNMELSKSLLELTRNQRSRQVERLFKEVIASVPGDVVLLDNLEVLFDPALEVETLRLLQVSSRNRTVVASWNGTWKDGTLIYAEPGHPEFAQFKQTQAVVVTASESASN
jgi:ABC-type uncharacterized transport system ATPase component